MITKKSKLLFEIKNRTVIKRFLLHLFKRRIDKMPNGEDKSNALGKYYFNYHFDCKKPRTFNECLCWLKYNYQNQLWCRCADKIESKKFLESLGLKKYIPKTLGVFNSVSEINLDVLPDQFVLKTNHDCGSVFVCKKGLTDFRIVFKKLQESLGHKYSNNNSEWVYQNIKPLIFAEELLESSDGELKDYKIQTIGGKYIFGYVFSNKSIDERHELFEEEFKFVDCLYQTLTTQKSKKTKKPNEFDEMIRISELIGKHFLEVRVDLYLTTKGIKIGELTFFTQSGLGQFSKKTFDFKYGKYLRNAIFSNIANDKTHKFKRSL